MKSIKTWLLICLQLLVFQLEASLLVTPNVSSQSLILNKLIGSSRLHKTIVFERVNPLDVSLVVTISSGNAFDVSGSDNLTVFATKDDPANITAQLAITTITNKFYRILTETPMMGTNVTIDANVIINGDLIIADGGDLVVLGDLIVRGAVSIGSGATLIVKGDIIFDGDDADAMSIAGTVSAQGVRDADGSKIRDGNIVIRNATSSSAEAVLISAAMTATGSITIENNSNTGGTTKNGVNITAAVTATYGSIVIAHNSSTTEDGISVSAAMTANKDIIMIDNSTTATNFDGVQLATTITSEAGQILVCNNSGDGSGYGAHISAGTVTAFKDLIFKNNTSSGSTGFFNSGTLVSDAGFIINQNNKGGTDSSVSGTLSGSSISGEDAAMTNDPGGNATATGGTGDGTGAGGDVEITGGTGGATDGAGGDVIIKGESGTGGGVDGKVSITTGDATFSPALTAGDIGLATTGDILVADQNQNINLISLMLHILKAARIAPVTTSGSICFSNLNNAGISRATFDSETITLTLDSDAGTLTTSTTMVHGSTIISGGAMRFIGDGGTTTVTTGTSMETVDIQWLSNGRIEVISSI